MESNTASEANTKFPTVGLKSLLQNSDLLEILLKPFSKADSPDSNLSSSQNSDETSYLASNLNEFNPDLIANNQHEQLNDLTSLIDVSKTKCLFALDNSDDCLQNKVNKITNGENEAANIYGNAFLGPNLWDKNDLFQGGVKFEHLEIDEFLNENGLNETDVEFLDQIQKVDPVANSNQISTYGTTSASTSARDNSSSISSSSSSPSSKTPLVNSSKESSSVSITKPVSQAQLVSSSAASKEHHQSMLLTTEPKIDSNSEIIGSKNLSAQIQQNSCSDVANIHLSLEKEQISSESSSKNFKSSINENSFDWTVDSNDMSMSSSNDLDDFDPKMKFSDEDLRPQPVLRKSKKQFVPNELKDEKYWARRRKNNIAAKRSRDARRIKENQIAIRASYLERENDGLRKQLEEFRRETKSLKNKLEKYELLYPELKNLDEKN